MALENILHRIGLVSAADLSAKQFYAVQLVSGTDYLCTLSTAVSYKPGGILQNKPKASQAADVAVLGICKYLAGGTIHNGDRLTSTTTGKLIATTTAGDYVYGIALTEASDGDVATMYVNSMAGANGAS